MLLLLCSHGCSLCHLLHHSLALFTSGTHLDRHSAVLAHVSTQGVHHGIGVAAMHVDDLAEAMHFLMCEYSDDLHINVGTGRDMSIEELVDAICEVSGFRGSISFDRSMSEGVLHKLLDVRRINQLGWVSKINIYEGLEETWKWLNLAHDNGKIRV